MKAAIYVRVSIELEVQASSLVAQEELFIKYIIDNGFTLFKVYSDSLTVTKGNRPGFERMIRDAKEKKFDIILAKEVSRFARNIGTSEVLDNQMIELEKQMASHLESTDSISMKKSFEHLKSQLATYANFDVIDREVLNRFVSKIVVHENETIEITYKFKI